jgi:hypothetical protein
MIFNAAFRGLIAGCSVKNPVSHFALNEHDVFAWIWQFQPAGNPRISMLFLRLGATAVRDEQEIPLRLRLSFLTALKRFNNPRCMESSIAAHSLDIYGQPENNHRIAYGVAEKHRQTLSCGINQAKNVTKAIKTSFRPCQPPGVLRILLRKCLCRSG